MNHDRVIQAILIDPEQVPKLVYDLNMAMDFGAKSVMLIVGHPDDLGDASSKFERGEAVKLSDIPAPDEVIHGSVLTVGLPLDIGQIIEAIGEVEDDEDQG